MRVKSTVKLNMPRIKQLTQAAVTALELTGELLHEETQQAQVFPFDTGNLQNESKISGKTRLSGYIDRYNSLKPYCKEAIIILSSEGKIAFNNHKIVLIKKIDYKDFEGAIKDWIKCAFYLGVVFSKTTEDHLSFFLGVDTK